MPSDEDYEDEQTRLWRMSPAERFGSPAVPKAIEVVGNLTKEEVDTGLLLRNELPATWSAFQHVQASWSRVRTVVREAKGLAADRVPVHDALQRAAVGADGVEGEPRGVAQLRHDIALDILRNGVRHLAEGTEGVLVPDRKAVDVRLVLTVPALAWLGRTKEQAQLSADGPIDLETAKALAGEAKSFIRVLADPCTGARLVMDQKVYSAPGGSGPVGADPRRPIPIPRLEGARPPGGHRPRQEWQHGGRTDADNLVIDRSSHDLKSVGLFEEVLLASGAAGWIDSWRHRFEDPPNDPLGPAPPELLPAGHPADVCPF